MRPLNGNAQRNSAQGAGEAKAQALGDQGLWRASDFRSTWEGAALSQEAGPWAGCPTVIA